MGVWRKEVRTDSGSGLSAEDFVVEGRGTVEVGDWDVHHADLTGPQRSQNTGCSGKWVVEVRWLVWSTSVMAGSIFKAMVISGEKGVLSVIS